MKIPSKEQRDKWRGKTEDPRMMADHGHQRSNEFMVLLDSVDVLEAALINMLKIDFTIPWQTELNGDRCCFYCEAYLEDGGSHADDCAWLQAKRLLSEDESV